jgi:hypothetical protein
MHKTLNKIKKERPTVRHEQNDQVTPRSRGASTITSFPEGRVLHLLLQREADRTQVAPRTAPSPVGPLGSMEEQHVPAQRIADRAEIWGYASIPPAYHSLQQCLLPGTQGGHHHHHRYIVVDWLGACMFVWELQRVGNSLRCCWSRGHRRVRGWWFVEGHMVAVRIAYTLRRHILPGWLGCHTRIGLGPVVGMRLVFVVDFVAGYSIDRFRGMAGRIESMMMVGPCDGSRPSDLKRQVSYSVKYRVA